jgi:AcrR family transcriptional regulator
MKTKQASTLQPFYILPDDPPSKREILKASLKLFVHRGLSETNIRLIGKTAGYSNPALFKFFKSKDALALYLYERCYLRLFEAVDSAIQSSRPFETNLRALLAEFYKIMDEDLEAYLYIMDYLREFWPRLPEAIRKKTIIQLIYKLFEQGVREGRLAKEMSPRIRVAAFIGFLNQFSKMLYFKEVQGDSSQWTQDVESVVMKMIAK